MEQTPVQKMEATFNEILSALNSQKTVIEGLIQSVKKARIASSKAIKESAKAAGGNRKKQKQDKEKRLPSGIHKPGQLSDELCRFLGFEPGTKLARTTVTPMITNYIRDHGLQDPENKRNIIPDEPLAKLLGIETGSSSVDGEKLNYFNIQGLLSRHYIKPETV